MTTAIQTNLFALATIGPSLFPNTTYPMPPVCALNSGQNAYALALWQPPVTHTTALYPYAPHIVAGLGVLALLAWGITKIYNRSKITTQTTGNEPTGVAGPALVVSSPNPPQVSNLAMRRAGKRAGALHVQPDPGQGARRHRSRCRCRGFKRSEEGSIRPAPSGRGQAKAGRPLSIPLSGGESRGCSRENPPAPSSWRSFARPCRPRGARG